MKTLSNKFLALLLITSVAFLSCKKDDHLTPIFHKSVMTSTTEGPGNTPVISQNDWQITFFEVNKTNETKLFSEYMFVFATDGILKAITKNNSVNGTWSSHKGTPEILIINFPSDPLNKLNNEWQIISRTSAELKLERINRNGAPEYLTFQRIQAQPELGQLEPPQK